MTTIVECIKCGEKTTNTRTRECDACKVKQLVAKWGCKDYKK